MHLASCVLAFLFLSNWKAYELLQGLLETVFIASSPPPPLHSLPPNEHILLVKCG